MRAIRSRDTLPEMAVRSLVHRLGYRFRLHRRDLPGKPDLVFPVRRKVIFVHGCFWHSHACKTGLIPKTNRDFWLPKLEGIRAVTKKILKIYPGLLPPEPRRNKARDKKNLKDLTQQGWDALTIWQCELKNSSAVRRRVKGFLGPMENPGN